MPRGTGSLGFFEDPAHQLPIKYIHLASMGPEQRRPRPQKLRSDRAAFKKLIEAGTLEVVDGTGTKRGASGGGSLVGGAQGHAARAPTPP